MSPGSTANVAFQEMCQSTSTTDKSYYQYVNGWVGDLIVIETSQHNPAA